MAAPSSQRIACSAARNTRCAPPLNRYVRTHLKMDQSGSLEQHLLGLESRLLEPATRKDAAAVASLLSDDFVEFGSSGRIFDKDSVIAALGDEVPSARSISDFKLYPLADGVALVTYIAISGNGPDQTPRESLRSSIWRRRGAEWKMTFHQGTLRTK